MEYNAQRWWRSLVNLFVVFGERGRSNGKTLGCCGVQLRLNGKVEVLEVKGKLLDFDFLLVMDDIKSLGEVCINQTSEVRFTTDDVPVCTTLKIDDPDFSIEFN